jgi:NADH:ubiquinone oxidoreductase subunit 6 (subunit J)
MDHDVIQKLGGNTEVLSTVMFNQYTYPIQLSGILLTAALVAVVAIAKRKNSKKGEQ